MHLRSGCMAGTPNPNPHPMMGRQHGERPARHSRLCRRFSAEHGTGRRGFIYERNEA
jgi:hypothetical protein